MYADRRARAQLVLPTWPFKTDWHQWQKLVVLADELTVEYSYQRSRALISRSASEIPRSRYFSSRCVPLRDLHYETCKGICFESEGSGKSSRSQWNSWNHLAKLPRELLLFELFPRGRKLDGGSPVRNPQKRPSLNRRNRIVREGLVVGSSWLTWGLIYPRTR